MKAIKESCCGCACCAVLCHAHAIEMREDERGFVYPHVLSDKCTGCNRCVTERGCAFIEQNTESEYSVVYAAKHVSDDVRRKSTSGGVFTALSDAILESGGVVYGAAYDDGFILRHIRTDDISGRDLCRGSKYHQSDMSGAFAMVRNDLQKGIRVLFSGTPCQCDALKKYLACVKADATDLYLMDFICTGVPPQKLFTDYIEYAAKRKKTPIRNFSHRSKKYGWKTFTNELTFETGKTDMTSALSQGYKNLFRLNIAMRPSCYNCPYASERRVSDITIGDYWNIGACIPDFEDTLGVSLIIINSAAGLRLLERSRENLILRESRIEDAKKRNHWKSCQTSQERINEFWLTYADGGIQTVLQKYAQCDILGKAKAMYLKLFSKPGAGRDNSIAKKLYTKIRRR